MADDYWVRVDVKLGCGCRVALGTEVPEGDDEPSSKTIMAVLGIALMDADVYDLLAYDEHMERGHEAIDIKVRVKVGPLPEELPDE